MKRFICIVALLMTVLPIAASGELVSVSELRAQSEVFGRWVKNYEAHGREIEIDIPIIIPRIDSLPVVDVVPIPAQSVSPRQTEFGEVYDISEFVNMPTQTANKNKLVAFDENAQVYYPYEINSEEVFAEDNPLSLSDAETYLQNLLDQYYDGYEYSIDCVTIKERAKTRNGRAVSEAYPAGVYWIDFFQQIHGMPVFAKANDLFDSSIMRDLGIRNQDTGFEFCSETRWYAEIMNENAWFLRTLMLEPVRTQVSDMPVASLDSVIASIEEKINSGIIRNVYALRLGYVIFMNEDSPKSFTLYPMWCLECEYTQSAKAKDSREMIEDGGERLKRLLDTNFREGATYERVGINVQTGEIIDRYTPTLDAMKCPPILTWEEVR